MYRKKICGLFLVAGMLLSGAAMAGDNPGQGLVVGQSGEVGMVKETAVLPEVVAPETTDAAVPGKDSIAREEAVPEAVAVEEGDDAAEAVEEVSIADPIEPLNRVIFQFNDTFYFWALKPVARGYAFIVPEPARISVRNFFRNVKMPIRFTNSLLQAKFKGAGTELARFGINSTLGVAGFFDVAKDTFGLNPSDEDFGQTLGFYGMGGLMYIVWPILGPSTVRDTIGLAGDSFLSPARYITPFEAALGLNVFEQVNRTSLDLGAYEDLLAASLEPYIGVRDRRAHV